jgi:hypothetical protein
MCAQAHSIASDNIGYNGDARRLHTILYWHCSDVHTLEQGLERLDAPAVATDGPLALQAHHARLAGAVDVGVEQADLGAGFTVDLATGKLTLVQNVPVEGEIPRNICLDPTGKWLVAAHQNSGTAALFKVDQDSGKLAFTGTKVNVPGSICVRFLGLD